MANPEHLTKLQQALDPGSKFPWNQWRRESPELKPDLSKAYLERIDFTGLDLKGVNFREADLMFASFVGCDLSDADFKGANLCYAILRTGLAGANLQSAHLLYARLEGAVLRGANLQHADLRGASLDSADLTDAKIDGANLQRASLVDASLERAHLVGCLVYGISAWNVNLEGAVQSDLLVNRWYAGSPIEFYSPTGVDQSDEPELVVDDLELAQFIHVMLSNQKLRKMIDTVTSKMVLILGRFTNERKSILDAIRGELGNRGLLPVMFDFTKPTSRDLTETVSTLAHLAYFVIADITDAKSIPQELERIVPHLPSVPVQPLLLASQKEYGMFEHFRRFPWVLEPVLYQDQRALLAELAEKVIAPAEAKAHEQTGR